VTRVTSSYVASNVAACSQPNSSSIVAYVMRVKYACNTGQDSMKQKLVDQSSMGFTSGIRKVIAIQISGVSKLSSELEANWVLHFRFVIWRRLSISRRKNYWSKAKCSPRKVVLVDESSNISGFFFNKHKPLINL
jgi:hypothetical protein